MNLYQPRQIDYRIKAAKKSIRQAKSKLERYSKSLRRQSHIKERMALTGGQDCSF